MAQARRPAVCIVRHNYYPDTHVRRDAEALVDAGYDVSVVALRKANQPSRERLDGVEVHRLPVQHVRGSTLRYAWEYASFALLAFLTVAWLHLRSRFRVVEVDNMPDLLVFSALVPKLFGARVILYIRSQALRSARHPLYLRQHARALCRYQEVLAQTPDGATTGGHREGELRVCRSSRGDAEASL
jgi:hypothetical protein